MIDQPNLPNPDSRSRQLRVPIFRFHLLGELQVAYRGEQIAPPPFRVRGLLAALLLRWLDVEAFRGAVAGPDLHDWQRALALYRGDLLEGVYNDWLLAERETLYLHYLHLSHRACDELLRRRQIDELLPLAERLVQAEPYDEKALRTLMQAYRVLGRRGAALAIYDRFLVLAADELGAEPEAATQALAESIRCTDARAGLSAAASMSDDDSPETVLRRARMALAQGDRATVEAAFRHLRNRPGSQDDACLLEVDLALFFEEYQRAADLLEACDDRQGPVLVRIARLAHERRQAPASHDAASAALIRAHETGDRQTEMEAVLALALAQRQLGQSVQAARSAEQALSLARACASAEGVFRALAMKGHSHFRQGQYAEALSAYHEARSLAYEHGLRCCLAEAMHHIAWIQSYQGALGASLASAQEALGVWRDLGVSGREASTLQILAYALAQLGRTAEALHAMEQAGQICDELGEPVRAAVNQYHLADTMLYHDDALAPRAISVAQAALDTFRAHDQPGWEAATLSTEGHAHLISGQYAAALHNCWPARDWPTSVWASMSRPWTALAALCWPWPRGK
jgi:DNA-binding SARP family transcriptional activator